MTIHDSAARGPYITTSTATDPTAPIRPDIAALAEYIDLDAAPYSTRFSRLLVLSADGMATWTGRERSAPAQRDAKIQELTVLRVAYERSAGTSIIADRLRLLAEGDTVGWRAGADGVRFDTGARLLVTDDDRVLVTGLRAGDLLEFIPRLPQEESGAWPEGCASSQRLRLEGGVQVAAVGDRLQVRATGDAAISWASVPVAPTGVGELAQRHDEVLVQWMERSPQVRAERKAMVDLCWWVLGTNTIQMEGGSGERAAVVPSKLGYVGLWQWDAYFIALGLRHGDQQLARTQMEIALGNVRADGQLPDVVHDHGVLDSSEDLPPGDLENLRRLGSPTLAGDIVPLTKPPLTALTLDLLAQDLGSGLIDEHLGAVMASQEWWFDRSDPGSTGWPAYLHPYSSGLDDSPVFDDNAILRSPDLAAYLVGQDRILARWLGERGREEESRRCSARSERLRGLLESCWDVERELFVLPGESTQVSTRSILNLLALLIPDLRPDIRDSLLSQITDPARFGGRWMLPTVSRDDPDFSPERMWRGPVWVNTAWLVTRALDAQGEHALADAVRANVMDLVMHAGGPSEYFNPDSGEKAQTATVLFGWSSALFVEMARHEASRVLQGTSQ